MLAEDAPAGYALVEHLGLDLLSACPPLLGALVVAAFLGKIGAARRRHPAHHLGRDEVLGLTADFPDALIRLAPMLQGGVDEPGEPFPYRRHDLRGAPAELDVHRV